MASNDDSTAKKPADGTATTLPEGWALSATALEVLAYEYTTSLGKLRTRTTRFGFGILLVMSYFQF